GKNALLAAASCALNLHTLTQFGSGMARVNVGVLKAGTAKNIVPSQARMEIETRGSNEELNQMLMSKVNNVIKGSAKTFDVEYEIMQAGGAPAYDSHDDEFINLVYEYLKDEFKIKLAPSLGGSEDVTYMMNRVEENGGKSIHFIFGSDLKAAHHNNKFDFDEDTLPMAFKALKQTIKLLNK